MTFSFDSQLGVPDNLVGIQVIRNYSDPYSYYYSNHADYLERYDEDEGSV